VGGTPLGIRLDRLVLIALLAFAVTFPVRPFSPDRGLAAGTAAPTAASTATAAPSPTPTGGPGPTREPTPPRHYVVLIVIDAGRPSDLTFSGLPHIHALMAHGVVYDRAWVGEMESTTPSVHVTFGTGTLPKDNGFLGFGWAVPQTRKTVDFRTLLADGQIDPVLKSLAVPSVAARLHQFMPKAVSVAGSGHKDYAVVGLGGGYADYELYGKFVTGGFVPAFMHAPPPLTPAERQSLTIHHNLTFGEEDSFAFQYALDVVRHVRPRLLMLNLPEMDTWGHWYGPDDKPLFQRLMQNIDRGIGEIESTYQKLGLLSKTDFIITADHAMMESRPSRNWTPVESLAQTVGAHVVRGDGEGGSIWLDNPDLAKAVATRIVAMKPNHVEAVFYRSASGLSYSYVRASPLAWLDSDRVAAALQHLVDTTAGRNGPDVWVLYRENYTVVPRNVAGTWKGTHGGATWKVQHIPLVLSGPGIKSGVHSQFPARAVDIAPTMERLLGLPPIHRDGVILADALVVPTSAELAPQRAVAPQLVSDVEAIQAQSNTDDRGMKRWQEVPPPIVRCTRSGSHPPPGCITNGPGTAVNG
jgi:arylsulfatase A-like enzyme